MGSRIKATAMGSAKWVPVEWIESTHDLILEKRSKGCTILAAQHSPRSMSLKDYRRGDQPVLLILGNEVEGISEETLGLSDVILEIPIGGMVESLNVATAAAILLYSLVGNEAREIRDQYMNKADGT